MGLGVYTPSTHTHPGYTHVPWTYTPWTPRLDTTRNSSCGKLMFSQVCVIPSVHWGGLCVSGLGGVHPTDRKTDRQTDRQTDTHFGHTHAPWTRTHLFEKHTHTVDTPWT